ncbi:MAG: hypothetical protein AB7F37_13705 [Variibacter sp.]
MPLELFDHPMAIQRALSRVMQDVQPDQTAQDVLIFAFTGAQAVRLYRFS